MVEHVSLKAKPCVANANFQMHFYKRQMRHQRGETLYSGSSENKQTHGGVVSIEKHLFAAAFSELETKIPTMWDQHVRFPQALHSQLIAANVAAAANLSPVPCQTRDRLHINTRTVIRGVAQMLDIKHNTLG